MAIPERNDDRDGGADDAARAAERRSQDAPTQALDLSTVGDRCVNCGASLSSDQRYCVNCGERRTKPRFSLSEPPGATAPAPAGGRPPRWARWAGPSSGATLVAGVGTLLLALGVGVLIGRTNSNGSSKAAAVPAVRIVTVNNGAGAGSQAAAPSSSTGNGKPASAKSKAKIKATPAPAAAAKANAKPITPVEAKKASQAASKVLGGNNLPPPTVTVGAKGSGPGYQKGSFTGNFFGQ